MACAGRSSRRDARKDRALIGTALAVCELVRLPQTLVAVAFLLLGAYLGAESAAWVAPPVLRAALVVGLVVAFGFAINDRCDAASDALARPHRPLPSGRISIRLAEAVAVLLSGTALVLGCSLGPTLGSMAAGTVTLAAAYSFWLKNTLLLGNVAMAVLVASIPVYGAMAAGRVTLAVMAAVAMALPYVLAQEILFCVEDEEQDRQAGLKTTANRLGAERALALVQLFLGAFVVVAVLPALVGRAPRPYLPTVLLCSVLPALAMTWVLTFRVSGSPVRTATSLVRVTWLSGFLPLVLLK